MGLGMGFGLENMGVRMGTARYAAATAAGGLMMGPRDTETRRGAILGAGVGAAGGVGMMAFGNRADILSGFRAGATPGGATAFLGREREAALGILGRFGEGPSIKSARSSVIRATQTLMDAGTAGTGMMGRGSRIASGVGSALSEAGGTGLLKRGLKGGVYGALVGAAALGSLGLMSGGNRIRSNEPVY